ncbi:hypothetical protein JG687_00008902 [Phytophthora cactorum]|uniref:Uncharacterized protein n=1 Tax=Phytophthora cactorum TaxID=29920 RepID=A0A8T1UCN3_9STRA|nr:hypothetical protein JG687_00008902 [Phytophthora cactorum]
MHLNNRVLVKILDQASRSSIRSHQRPHSIKVHLTLKLCQYRRKAANTSMASTRSPSKFEFHRQITQSDDPQLGRGVGLVYLGLGLQDGEGQGPQQQWQRAIITPPTRVHSPTHVRRCRPVNNRVTEHSNDCQLFQPATASFFGASAESCKTNRARAHRNNPDLYGDQPKFL